VKTIYIKKRLIWNVSHDLLTGKKILEKNYGIVETALKLDLSTTRSLVLPFKRIEISSHKF